VAETLILVSVSPGERRVAVLRDDRLHLAVVERPARPDGVGDLHRARVSAISKPMSGAFLALADGSTAFLPENEASADRLPIGKAVQEGLVLPVRVTRAAQGGKGPRVTARLTESERAAAAGEGVALLRRGPDAALRVAAAFRDAPVLVDGAAEAARLRARLGAARVALQHRPAFDDALEAEFDGLCGPDIPLPGGGRLLVHPTPALTAIDVDAGSAAGIGDAASPMRLNELALAEAARQIRLRNLAGAILVDVAGLTPKRREALAAPFAAALAEDPLRPRLLGLTRLGLFEVQRQRIHPPLHEVLGWPPSPLSHGLVALRRAAREAALRPSRRLALRAAPAVLAAIGAEAGALAEYAAGAGSALALCPDRDLAPGREVIEDAA
jgi:Ribonuclease G/E